jgi:DNA-binding CsgD family transcriptional regulator
VTGFLTDSKKNPGLKEYEAELGEDHGLSKREAEIMNWINRGKTNAEIGSILGISTFTVKNHMQRIFKKLEVYNRIQAVSKSTRAKPD